MAFSDNAEFPTEPFMQFDKFALRCYTSEDIRKLSILEINQKKTFDEAGFPIRSGLYDPALGSCDQYGSCDTCGLKGLYCPGHFGHIQLSFPVFNPLLFSFAYNLMRGSCIHCHLFTCSTRSKTIEKSLEELKSLFGGLSKNDVMVKHAMRKEFLRDILFKRRTRCPHCKRTNGQLRNDMNRAFILDFTGKFADVKKTKEEIRIAIQQDKERKVNFVTNDLDPSDMEVDEEKKDVKLAQMDSSGVQNSSVLDPLLVSEKNLSQSLNQVLDGRCTKLVWRAVEVRQHLRILWQKEAHVLKQLFPIFEEVNEGYPIDLLFCESILVQPSKFRPMRVLAGEKFEHSITANLRKLLEADQLLTIIRASMKAGNAGSLATKELIEQKVQGTTMNEKLHNAYLALQVRANCLYDQEADKLVDTKLPGLRQILEKKQGLFRMNMMGKRVNYACRSVITPDPYLDVDEIGIPELFARRLTFAEPANYLNTPKLRELIRRGPLVHPGANFIQSKGNFKQVLTASRKESDRNNFALRIVPGMTDSFNSTPTYVFRHLEKGDGLLMNRQPSLHKPSIMGHKARILKGQNALRMNYAPCKAYNADFDGDEMNGHFPQNRIAQAEVGNLARHNYLDFSLADVGSNYLVPKDGTPILGLIQDHVISGVLMTLRNRFFDRADFMHLVFSAFAETTKRINIPVPAMFKPKIQWTGKQIITTIVQHHIPDDHPKINLIAKAKTPLACWKMPNAEIEINSEMSESYVVFRGGELLCGVLDKQHYGTTQYGLIHCCYELYGPKVATGILSCFSRVFTTFLQFHGFSLGVADILVTKQANRIRRKSIREIRKCGPEVVRKTFNLLDDATPLKMKHVLATAYNNPRKEKTDVKQLDYTMKQSLAKLCEQINDACVPKGLIRQFPNNALQLMIQSGAKGSMVNSIQISCALGQIELEGQRPPLSVVGRTLPSFRCFDPSPRAGGFIDQRFLTGLNPQELFFHTMAGREGLIDTAVKTSRSGYLQRCLIKHLEGLSVSYDQTVRDYDGSVVQFRYGEDGMDVGRATFLNPKQFSFLADNVQAAKSSAVASDVRDSDWNVLKTERQFRKCSKWKKTRAETIKSFGHDSQRVFESGFTNFCKDAPEKKLPKDMVKDWFSMDEDLRSHYQLTLRREPQTVDMKYNPARNLGAMSEKILEDIDCYARKHDTTTEFKRAIYWKGLRALADPGENVGLLAAQSIGEPSTQMTLNTFHFAGRGEMNVTLGIPRLREILMTAGKNISTPMAEITVREGVSDEKLENLKRDFNPVFLKNLIKRFILDEKITTDHGESSREYVLTIELLRNKDREIHSRHVSRKKIMHEVETRFAKEVSVGIGRRFKDMIEHQQITQRTLRASNMAFGISVGGRNNNREDGMSSDEEAVGGKETDAGEARLNKRHLDDAAEYEGEDEERDEILEKEPNNAMDYMEEIMDDSEEEQESDRNDESRISNEHEVNSSMEKNEESRRKVVDEARIQAVIGSHHLIVGYNYDFQDNRWCVVTYKLPLKNKSKLDAMAIVESVVSKFIVREIPGIEKCIVREENKNGRPIKIVQTQGINVEALYKRSDMLDVNTLYSNDIDLMLRSYGIEACGRTIATEMNNVFGVYGIEVNPRHLSLTADYMTFTGEVQPFNRTAMANCVSPLQRMTFETTVVFMRDAIVEGEYDKLASPSSRLVTGQLQRSGTGAFDLLSDPLYVTKVRARSKITGKSKATRKRKSSS